jgi:transcriptional regulator of acetoin/glycerol metabolism
VVSTNERDGPSPTVADLRAALDRCHGNISQAAAALGTTRWRVEQLCRSAAIDTAAFREPTVEQIEAVLAQCGGNVSRAAEALGRSRKQLYRWLEKHGIDPSSFRHS